MAGLGDILRSFRLKRARRHWSALPAHIETVDQDALPPLAQQAAAMEKLVMRAKSSLAKRQASFAAAMPDAPPRTEAQYVPDPWLHRVSPTQIFPERGQKRLGEVEVFHDAQIAEVTCKQAVFDETLGVEIDGLGFDGSYLSLVFQTPPSIREGLTTSTLIGAAIDITDEANSAVHIRVNVRHGPNVERLVREVEVNKGPQVVEFDIFHTDVDPGDISELWVDIILQDLRMNRFVIRGVQLFRRPRAHV